MEYRIRKAGPADVCIIREIADLAFRATYASIITQSQIEYMLEWMYSEGTLRKELEGDVTYLLLEADGTAVGYTSFLPETPALYHLHKIYILPEFQGKGGGKILFTAAQEQMKECGAEAFELNVNRNNKAVGFYRQMGMHIDRSGDFDIGDGFFMNDYIMRKELW